MDSDPIIRCTVHRYSLHFRVDCRHVTCRPHALDSFLGKSCHQWPVIVDIDEASQLELGQWPWPRQTLATIVNRLFDDYGIKVLGFDALFAEAEETSAERYRPSQFAHLLRQLDHIQ